MRGVSLHISFFEHHPPARHHVAAGSGKIKILLSYISLQKDDDDDKRTVESHKEQLPTERKTIP